MEIGKIHRALICRKIESLFDSTSDVEKLLSYGPVHFDYHRTIKQLNSHIEIRIISGPNIENEIMHELSRWLTRKKISYMKVFESTHPTLIIQKDSHELFIKLIKPTEFDKLWDEVSNLI